MSKMSAKKDITCNTRFLSQHNSLQSGLSFVVMHGVRIFLHNPLLVVVHTWNFRLLNTLYEVKTSHKAPNRANSSTESNIIISNDPDIYPQIWQSSTCTDKLVNRIAF
jgi:hypothetical protein